MLAEHLQLSQRLAAEGRVEVDSPTLKRVTGWEPRLLMKFDSRAQRPTALGRATILPIRNGTYAIVACDGYHDLEEPARRVSFAGSENARRLVTLPWDSLPSSESQALDMALASGMLRDFLEEDELTLTIRGRLRCPPFEFHCRTHAGGQATLHVDGVQTEVDAGLEGEQVHLIEAKLGSRDNFHVRQLYYPFRLWSLRSSPKRVTGVFCCYSDRLFHLWQYAFEPLEDYHGIRLLRSASYSLDPEEGAPSLPELLARTRLRTPTEVPFPQADSLTRLVDLVEGVAAGCEGPADLMARYGFTSRQADYYFNATRFLGLAESGANGYRLTPEGVRLVHSRRNARHSQIIAALAELPVFRPALEQLAAGHLPLRSVVEELIRSSTSLSGTTVTRRATTVLAWLRWVQEMTSGSGASRQLTFDT